MLLYVDNTTSENQMIKTHFQIFPDSLLKIQSENEQQKQVSILFSCLKLCTTGFIHLYWRAGYSSITTKDTTITFLRL